MFVDLSFCLNYGGIRHFEEVALLVTFWEIEIVALELKLKHFN